MGCTVQPLKLMLLSMLTWPEPRALKLRDLRRLLLAPCLTRRERSGAANGDVLRPGPQLSPSSPESSPDAPRFSMLSRPDIPAAAVAACHLTIAHARRCLQTCRGRHVLCPGHELSPSRPESSSDAPRFSMLSRPDMPAAAPASFKVRHTRCSWAAMAEMLRAAPQLLSPSSRDSAEAVHAVLARYWLRDRLHAAEVAQCTAFAAAVCSGCHRAKAAQCTAFAAALSCGSQHAEQGSSRWEVIGCQLPLCGLPPPIVVLRFGPRRPDLGALHSRAVLQCEQCSVWPICAAAAAAAAAGLAAG